MIPDIGPEGGVGTMMLMMDPPQHTRYRKIVSSAFTPRVIRLFEEQVRRRSAEIVDSVIGRGECDFVTDVAAELPVAGDRRDPRRAAGRPRQAVRLVEQDGRQLGSRVPREPRRGDERLRRDVHLRQRARRGEALGADRRHRHRDRERRGRGRAPLRHGIRHVLHVALGRRQRDDAQRDHPRDARVPRAPRSVGPAARAPRAVRPRRRGDRAVGEPGDLLPALGDPRHRAARSAVEGRRQDHGVVPVGEP